MPAMTAKTAPHSNDTFPPPPKDIRQEHTRRPSNGPTGNAAKTEATRDARRKGHQRSIRASAADQRAQSTRLNIYHKHHNVRS